MIGIRSKVIIAGVAALALAGCGSANLGGQPTAVTVTAAPGSPEVAAVPTDCITESVNGGEVVCGAAATQAAAANAAASREAAAAQRAAAAKSAAAQKAAAERAHAIHEARIAAENTPISATLWGEVIRNPDAYQGNIYTITGTVTEYNINSNTLATQENAALVAEDDNGNDFVVEAPASLLGNVQPGDTFTAKVTVLGSEEAQNTVYGGTTEVPDFDASTFTITG